ncbi:lysine 5,6-aminomutase subunit alpha [Micromonospora sp. NPDC051296]|uniref:lysine 5,6-aminomutase subunit alpha n=1 Tax=Micromonospora sp. NPDC051296 TaxID=3155046 RepID=UPI003442C7DF
MEPKLDIDGSMVDSCHQSAQRITDDVWRAIAAKTTLSVERTIVRLLGIDGVDPNGVPIPNILVGHVQDRGGLASGIAYHLGNAMVQTGRSPQDIAKLVSARELDLVALPRGAPDELRRAVRDEAARTMQELRRRRAERTQWRASLDEQPTPHAYVLTATGNVYEDVAHARAVADAGGDIVAMIRSTAQSLLDYVPYGPTTEGHGGTFATQENFRIMREAMDDWSRANGRYVRLSSFCSGLCMPEIAAMGAIEGLDNMVNDALYGILYRDINIVRTLIDQSFSRRLNGYFGIVINTGEDNYLRTADAVTAAPSVVASQFINYHLARRSGVPDDQIGLGNAFEIHPTVTNGLLYEWAQAQLTRELFPNCPVKFMPPTKHMDGDLFRTQAVDTLFNLLAVATEQRIQTIGVPTEGLFTPHIHDRVIGMANVRYVANTARELAGEIRFRPGGIIQRRAVEVLADAESLLAEIAAGGLFAALQAGTFGNVSRRLTDGRGAEGMVDIDDQYFNPYLELMEESLDA